MSAQLFHDQIDYLSNRFAIVSLEEARSTRARDVLALTFDDGYRGVYEHALPILRDRGLPATVFLVTDRVGSSKLLWWDVLLGGVESLRRLPPDEGGRRAFALSTEWRERLLTGSPDAILGHYKSATAQTRRAVDGALSDLEQDAGRERIFLSAGEIREMQELGIEFGAHTRTHPILTWLDDHALEAEVVGSLEALVALTGRQQCWFAYPDGWFTDREEAVVARAGFTGAVQTFRRLERGGTFAVPRVGISPNAILGRDQVFSPSKLRWILSGLSRQQARALLSAGPSRGAAVS